MSGVVRRGDGDSASSSPGRFSSLRREADSQLVERDLGGLTPLPWTWHDEHIGPAQLTSRNEAEPLERPKQRDGGWS